MEVISNSNISYEEMKKLNRERSISNRKDYFKSYYENNTKNKIVFCNICNKFMLKSSLKYHTEKSKEHKINLNK
tara:strand:- start:21 stop:242 length:222 start_codon:yes stop_codon:yes gene_type:complete